MDVRHDHDNTHDDGWPADMPRGPEAQRAAVAQGLAEYHAGQIHHLDLAPYHALAARIPDDEE